MNNRASPLFSSHHTIKNSLLDVPPTSCSSYISRPIRPHFRYVLLKLPICYPESIPKKPVSVPRMRKRGTIFLVPLGPPNFALRTSIDNIPVGFPSVGRQEKLVPFIHFDHEVDEMVAFGGRKWWMLGAVRPGMGFWRLMRLGCCCLRSWSC